MPANSIWRFPVGVNKRGIQDSDVISPSFKAPKGVVAIGGGEVGVRGRVGGQSTQLPVLAECFGMPVG